MIKGLPERLKELRLHSGLSQRKVAEYLNVSPSIISSYETGERTPSTENLLAISYIYHCTTDYLLGREALSKATMINAEHLPPKQVSLLRELIESMRKESR